MANSKVVYDGETLIDISKDTVTPETLAKGATAHDSSGEPITGTMELGDYEGAINAHNESETAHQDIREDLNGKVSKSGDTMSGGLEVPSVGADGYVVYPDDGYLKLTGNDLVGAIKITLPISTTPQPNTTIKFRLNIFNWRERGAIDYVIGGYLYSRWMNVSAHCIAPNTYSNSDLPVSFGFENGKYVCIIGTPTTVWHYPSFGIADILVGHQNSDYEDWASGWNIALTTESLSDVHVTLNGTNVTYDIQKQINELNDSVPQNVVMYTAQELSEPQKVQVRNNIAAICEEDTLQCIDNHDNSDTAHSDIREAITGLKNTVDNLDIQGGSGVTSWNDLTDKPFGEIKTEGVVEFNGDLTDKEVVQHSIYTLVKVSDKVLTEPEVIGSTVRISVGADNIELTVTTDLIGDFYENLMIADIDVIYLISISEPYEDFTVGTYFLTLIDETDVIAFVQSISCLTWEKRGLTNLINPENMPSEILAITGISMCEVQLNSNTTINWVMFSNGQTIVTEELNDVTSHTVSAVSGTMLIVNYNNSLGETVRILDVPTDTSSTIITLTE